MLLSKRIKPTVSSLVWMVYFFWTFHALPLRLVAPIAVTPQSFSERMHCASWGPAVLPISQELHVSPDNYRGLPKGWFSKRVVVAYVPLERKPERGYVRMFPWNENWNEGTFACSPGTKTRTTVHSPEPPFYETALLSPSDINP